MPALDVKGTQLDPTVDLNPTAEELEMAEKIANEPEEEQRENTDEEEVVVDDFAEPGEDGVTDVDEDIEI